MFEGLNNSQNVQMDPSPLEDGKWFFDSDKSSKDSDAVLDQGSSYGNESNADSKQGSPCFSVHTRSTERINMIGGEDLNYKNCRAVCVVMRIVYSWLRKEQWI